MVFQHPGLAAALAQSRRESLKARQQKTVT